MVDSLIELSNRTWYGEGRETSYKVSISFEAAGCVRGHGEYGVKMKEEMKTLNLIGSWSRDSLEVIILNDPTEGTMRKVRKLTGRLCVNSCGKSYLSCRVYHPYRRQEENVTLTLEEKPGSKNSFRDNFTLNLASYFRHKNEMFYDFAICTKDGGSVLANKVILASQSRYFAAFFTNESEANEVSLQLGTDAIQQCLNYIYSGELHIDNSNVQEVLEAANYLALVDIVELCCAHMVVNMELDNVLGLLVLADSLGLERLKAEAATFICSNFQAVFPSGESLAQLENQRLMMDLLSSDQLMLRRNNGIILVGKALEEALLALILQYKTACGIIASPLLSAVRLVPQVGSDDPTNVLDVWPSCLEQGIATRSSAPRRLTGMTCEYPGSIGPHSHSVFGFPSLQSFPERRPIVVHRGNDEKFIRSIAVSCRRWDERTVIGGIQINWSDGSHSLLGVLDDAVVLEVPETEHIAYVRGRSGWYVDQVCFITNTGRQLGPVGGDGGEPFPALILPADVDIRNIHLDGIQGSEVMTQGAWTPAFIKFIFVAKVPYSSIEKPDKTAAAPAALGGDYAVRAGMEDDSDDNDEPHAVA